ncbi:MAG TPA: non-homologous end-joining DNA ligase [Ilumatobacter sp.]|nr:non-homologous end-joining DNA ligase [Ilumatobacter sp.]
MKATLAGLPPAADDDHWAYEIKWDGYRTLAFVDGGQVRLQSSSGRDVTAQYPELAGLADGVHTGSAILDGELVVPGDDGVPRFELIQRHTSPAVMYVFDVLQVERHETIALGYLERRRLLGELVAPGDYWLVPGHRVGGGTDLLAATVEQGLEGVMAKRIDSSYRPGARSPDWRKVKNRRRTDVVIGGFTEGTGNRAGTFGALLVGVPGNTGLTFAGGVGTGFDQATLESLRGRLDALAVAACPFDPPPPASYRRHATWVRPDLVATVEIAEFTNDGLVRHASFVGLRDWQG